MPLDVLPLSLFVLTACSRPIMLTASHLLKNARRSWIIGSMSGRWFVEAPPAGAGCSFRAHRHPPVLSWVPETLRLRAVSVRLATVLLLMFHVSGLLWWEFLAAFLCFSARSAPHVRNVCVLGAVARNCPRRLCWRLHLSCQALFCGACAALCCLAALRKIHCTSPCMCHDRVAHVNATSALPLSPSLPSPSPLPRHLPPPRGLYFSAVRAFLGPIQK